MVVLCFPIFRWITQEQFDNFQSKWRKEQDLFRAKLGNLQQADEEYYMTAELLLQIASRSYELFIGSDVDEKREIIQLVFQNLSLNHGKP